MKATIILHGGAGRIRKEDRQNYRDGLIMARDSAYKILASGGSAHDAVITAILSMENNSAAFNAGVGAAINIEGTVELDAAIMHGKDSSNGAVAAMTNTKNPILIADLVRRELSPVFIVGKQANRLESKPIKNSELLTKRSLKALERFKNKNHTTSNTVGAVAIDKNGDMVAGTSTGGRMGKVPGRVGDAPIIGAGTLATKQTAISCTGEGEAFITITAAKELSLLLEHNHNPREAMSKVLEKVKNVGGVGGIICLNKEQILIGFNSEQMAFAWKTADSEKAVVSSEAGIIVI